MAIHVSIPAVFLPYTGGQNRVSATGTTIAEIIGDLDSRHPGLRDRIMTDDGRLRRFINVYVNDDDIRHSGNEAASVRDGDHVMILPAVAGG